MLGTYLKSVVGGVQFDLYLRRLASRMCFRHASRVPLANQRRLFVVPFVPQDLVDCLCYPTRWAVKTPAFHRADRSLKGPQRSRGLARSPSPRCQSFLAKHGCSCEISLRRSPNHARAHAWAPCCVCFHVPPPPKAAPQQHRVIKLLWDFLCAA